MDAGRSRLRRIKNDQKRVMRATGNDNQYLRVRIIRSLTSVSVVLYSHYHHTHFLPRREGASADKLHGKAAKIRPSVGLTRTQSSVGMVSVFVPPTPPAR